MMCSAAGSKQALFFLLLRQRILLRQRSHRAFTSFEELAVARSLF